MKVAILSSFPLFDKQEYKVKFLSELLKIKDIEEIVLLYSHFSLKDHLIKAIKRFNDIGYKSANKKINLNEIYNNIKLKDFAKRNNIKIYYFNRFSDEECADLMRKYKFDICHNFSGEFIPKKILDLPKAGILSAHYGKLPEIRGGDTIKWTIYLNKPMYVSLFFLTDELDMGDIVLLKRVKIEKDDDLYSIRKKCQEKAVEGHLEVLNMLLKNNIIRIKQNKYDGSTYFTMGKYLSEKVESILKQKIYGWYED